MNSFAKIRFKKKKIFKWFIEQILCIMVPFIEDIDISKFGTNFCFISLLHNICHYDVAYEFPIYRMIINSLRQSDAYIRQQTNHHWFR